MLLVKCIDIYKLKKHIRIACYLCIHFIQTFICFFDMINLHISYIHPYSELTGRLTNTYGPWRTNIQIKQRKNLIYRKFLKEL